MTAMFCAVDDTTRTSVRLHSFHCTEEPWSFRLRNLDVKVWRLV